MNRYYARINRNITGQVFIIMKIAIDGPAGAGKSTIAKLIAKELGYIYIDTGAMYRALTWKALQKNIKIDDADLLYEMALSTEIHFEYAADSQKLICDGQDLTGVIRSPEVTAAVSVLASHTMVREVMVKKQQAMADKNNVVMDGRDIGEKVLPEADFKFFLTASIDERTKRRIREWSAGKHELDYNKVKAELEERDNNDTRRETGSLKILPGSIILDSTTLGIDDLLHEMITIIQED